MNIVSLNSILLPAAEASIPIDDRGFRFGDGVFETIPVHNGTPYLLEYHLERLEAGLSALHILYDTSRLPGAIAELLHANQATDAVLRLYITRGVGSQGYLPALPAPEPTVLLQLMPGHAAVRGQVALFISKWQKIPPEALPVSSKIAQGVNATLARMEARENHCHDALQQNASGFISEASSANIFWQKNGTLYTPSLATGALAGVTRRRMIELTEKLVEGEFTLAHLAEADAVFLTNSTYGIVPVNALQPVGLRWDSAALATRYTMLRQEDISRRA